MAGGQSSLSRWGARLPWGGSRLALGMVALLVTAVLGLALFYGDGMITLDEFLKIPEIMDNAKAKLKVKVESNIDPETIKKFKEKFGGDK